ncbi:kinase-like protein [Gymnopus androsaceus JB14]|uniref:Kinase-like protein n=1 Tax=Gymnopus androsaceus JB14 TaxID=1447944 RepID=A0A6A4II64_9AGAR|nr:kinase-like protein [Gymnopus androsaceus JB14]
MTYDLAEALTALHDHGIAHRDIKPENLVYNEHFRLLLIDFDQTVSVTSENQNVSDQSGTRYWSAPGSFTLSSFLSNGSC